MKYLKVRHATMIHKLDERHNNAKVAASGMLREHGHQMQKKQILCTYNRKTGQVGTGLLGLSGHVSLQVVLLGLGSSQRFPVDWFERENMSSV